MVGSRNPPSSLFAGSGTDANVASSADANVASSADSDVDSGAESDTDSGGNTGTGSGLADADGDGSSDILVGAYLMTGAARGSGGAYLVAGGIGP